jgi:hypothetical protein
MSDDDGDWVLPKLKSLASFTPPEPTESGRMVLRTAGMFKGGVIFDAEHARALGELILEHHCEPSQRDRQRPLSVQEQGDCWLVEGSWNRERRITNPEEDNFGPFHMLIWKGDGRILDFGLPLLLPSVAESLEALQKMLAERADDQQADPEDLPPRSQ